MSNLANVLIFSPLSYPNIVFVARPVMGGAFALLALGLGLTI